MIDPDSAEVLVPKSGTYKSLLYMITLTLTLCCSSFFFGYGSAYFDSFEFKHIMGNVYQSQLKEDDFKSIVIRRSVPLGAIAGSLASFACIRYFSRRYSDHDVGGVCCS